MAKMTGRYRCSCTAGAAAPKKRRKGKHKVGKKRKGKRKGSKRKGVGCYSKCLKAQRKAGYNPKSAAAKAECRNKCF